MKNQRSVSIGIVLLAFALLGLLLLVPPTSAKVDGRSLPSSYVLSTPTDTPTLTPTCGPDWRLVESPNAGTFFSGFQAIATVSENDIWAVGYFTNFSGGESGPNQTLVEHWNGLRWSIVASPNVGVEDNTLNGVAALAANDVWAVGYADDQPLIEHWDGVHWVVASGPDVGPGHSTLNGVAAVSANDVWAVGYTNDQSQTLVTHWNGLGWSVVSSPNVGQSTNVLNGVAVASANYVWAVGFSDSQTLIEQWNGAQWSVVPSPNVGTSSNLSAVAVVSANDAWAVGQYYCPSSGCPQTVSRSHNLTLHWDGAQWNVVPAPQGGPYENFLNSLSVISANDVWAVGYYRDYNYIGQVLHWDGTQWNLVSWYGAGGEPYVYSEYVYGVTAISDGNVQVVGRQHNGLHSTNNVTFVMRWNGSQWNQVPTPDPIGTDPSGGSTLYDIEAISSNNIWAVGFIEDADDYPLPLVEHWDGTMWSVLSDSNIVPGQGQLDGIDAISADDIWAVGSVGSVVSANVRTLTLHWDGSAWRIVPSPNVGVVGNVLNSVAAISSNDAWAVGYTGNPDQPSGQTLIEHWDGSQWSVVPNPNPKGVWSTLQHVAAVSAQDVWAVGYSEVVNSEKALQYTLIEHWDGSQWSIVPSPNVGSMANRLNGVAVVSPDDVWAVGNSYDGTPDRTLVLHWNGTQWSVAPSPNSGSGSNFLFDVVALSSNDVWAVGIGNKTLAIHWDGVQWRIVATDNYGADLTYNRFFGVTAVAANDVWAVGDFFTSRALHKTLVERYRGRRLCQAGLVGHVMWQGRLVQPNDLQQLPVTLTLKSGDIEVNYAAQSTDASGFFTASISGLISGTYSWRVKGPQYVSNSGTVQLQVQSSKFKVSPPQLSTLNFEPATTSMEMGLMRTGDANDDNCVTVLDFNIVKNSFGRSPGEPSYDGRADFTGDGPVGVPDFNLLKINYGVCGSGPIYPAP